MYLLLNTFQLFIHLNMNTRRATGTLTAVTGDASVNIYCSTGRIKQIFMKPATGTTTFDVTLTDDNSNVIYTTTDEQGEMNDLTDLPAYMNYTLALANASADEAFKYVVMIDE